VAASGTPTTPSTNTNGAIVDETDSTGAIVGGVVGGVCGLLLLGLLIGFFVRRSRQRRSPAAGGQGTPPPKQDVEMQSARDWSAADEADRARANPVAAAVVASADSNSSDSKNKSAAAASTAAAAVAAPDSTAAENGTLKGGKNGTGKRHRRKQAPASTEWTELVGDDNNGTLDNAAFQKALIQYGTARKAFGNVSKAELHSQLSTVVDEMDVDDSGTMTADKLVQALNGTPLGDWLKSKVAPPSSNGTAVISHGSAPASGGTPVIVSSMGSLRHVAAGRHVSTNRIIAPDQLTPCEGTTAPQKLGAGGFGEVVKMHWLGGPFDVAVKTLLSAKDDASGRIRDAFANEAALQAELTHDNILQLYGIVLDGPQLAMVMPLMARSLFEAIHECPSEAKRFSWSERARICADIAAGLNYLHTRTPPLLHRDLKSPNVMLSKRDDVKLVDFGLADVKKSILSIRVASQSVSPAQGGHSVGTVQWNAPELHKRKPAYSEKSDIYALGMVAWELAAYRIPFEGVSQYVLPQEVAAGEREDIPDDTPEGFADAIRTCWAQSPDDRPNAKAANKLFGKLRDAEQ
jgi:hypothetical protein